MFLVKVGRTYRKLDNTDDISELVAPKIDPENSREFDPEIKLEHEEWFYIEIDDEHMSMIKEYEDKFLNTAGLNDVNEEEFSKIDLIFRKVENDGLVFQKITQSKRLVDKSILKWRYRRAESQSKKNIPSSTNYNLLLIFIYVFSLIHRKNIDLFKK